MVSQCGKFYHVRYEFQYEKGGTTIKVLPAMCEKMTLRSICLYFWSMSQMINDQNIYMLNASNKTWINENDIVELPFPDDTQTNA